MDWRKLAVLAVIAALVAAFFVFDLGRYLDLGYLQSQRGRLHDLFVAHPWRVGAAFFAVYVAVTGLSLPGAAVLTLVAGAIFGLGWGTVIVSFASTHRCHPRLPPRPLPRSQRGPPPLRGNARAD